MPSEYIPQAFSQLVNSVWYHHRQHLIQAIQSPTGFEKLENTLMTLTAPASTVAWASFAAFGATAANLVCNIVPIDSSQVMDATSAVETVALGVSFARDMYRNFSIHEREANKIMMSPKSTGTPFKVDPVKLAPIK